MQGTTLRDLLAGVILREAEVVVEKELNTLVKQLMKSNFPDNEVYLQYRAELKHRQDMAQQAGLACETLQSSFDGLKKSTADGHIKAQAARELKEAKQKHTIRKMELKETLDKSVKAPWILACHEAFPNDKMRQHVNDDGQEWDTYKLLKIIQFHLKSVFVQRLGGNQRRAYELLRGLVQVLTVRNTLAHRDTGYTWGKRVTLLGLASGSER